MVATNGSYSIEVDDPPPLQDRPPLATGYEDVGFSRSVFLYISDLIVVPFLFTASAANSKEQQSFGRLEQGYRSGSSGTFMVLNPS